MLIEIDCKGACRRMWDASVEKGVLAVSFSIWCTCTAAQLLTIVVVYRQREWATKSGMALILSLALSDCLQCLCWGIWGGLESLTGIIFSNYSDVVIGAVSYLVSMASDSVF